LPKELTSEVIAKLEQQHNIWVASVRPDGRPHLVPVWFVWHHGKIYIGTDPKSVKVNNFSLNPRVSLALEDGSHPVICEGQAGLVATPWPPDLVAAFFKKYEWDLHKETQYHDVWEITPAKWLFW
jgi:PPOX class probable F420-dependent enzyme